MVGHLKNVSPAFAQMPNRITNVEFTTVSATFAGKMLPSVFIIFVCPLFVSMPVQLLNYANHHKQPLLCHAFLIGLRFALTNICHEALLIFVLYHRNNVFC
jgi:hypothetical protein